MPTAKGMAMKRAYGGILGCLAFTTVLARGVVEQADLVATIPVACVYLFIFTAIGVIVGRIAEGIIAGSFANGDKQ